MKNHQELFKKIVDPTEKRSINEETMHLKNHASLREESSIGLFSAVADAKENHEALFMLKKQLESNPILSGFVFKTEER